MNISLSWLRDYIKTPTNITALSDRLRIASCEVEGVEDWSKRFDGLVVGLVKDVVQHPNADRLRIATVSLGNKNATIVCGGANLEHGQTVVVATPGTTLIPLKGEPFTIEKSTIRGQVSEGMLCGADEIGLNIPAPERHIMVLPHSFKPGTPFAEAFGLDTTVLDLEITPNRPDLLSYMGIAREIATLEKRSMTEPPLTLIKEQTHAKPAVKVIIENSHLCNRYSAVCLENVQVKESPLWLQARLLLSGIRPINTVVDVTNYVMLELGHPLHAFDLDALGGYGTEMTIKGARKGDRLRTLDGEERVLEHGDIIIADKNHHVIDLAGIMGGESSKVSESTTTVFLEAAHFLGSQIRKTSRHLGIRSEASARFEKGLDPESTVTALKRATYILKEIAGASVKGPLIDLYPVKDTERPRIHLSFAQVHDVLGVSIGAAEAKTILQHLGFQIPAINKSSLDAVPPSWRKDVTISQDLIEELVRIWGFDRLPLTLPSGQIKAPKQNTFYATRRALRHSLAAANLHECVHLSFLSKNLLSRTGFNASSCITLSNPLSNETEFLPPSHLPRLLENIAGPNLHLTELGLFEIGHVFSTPHQETEVVSIVLRSEGTIESTYRQMKSVIARGLQGMRLPEATYSATAKPAPYYQEGSVVDISIEGSVVGTLGQVEPHIVEASKIRSGRTIVFAEMNLDILIPLPKQHFLYKEPHVFPVVKRDLTMIVKKEVPAQNILDLLKKSVDGAITSSYEITTIYSGKPIPEDSKSVTIHFTYNHPERTLEDKEVNDDQKRLSTILTGTIPSTIN